MFLWGLAIAAYVIVDCDDANKAVSDLVHAYPEDVLAPLQTKGHVQEPIPCFVGIETGQV